MNDAHSEFERRTQGSIRGDAKKFALERAADFITTFGLPPEFQGIAEPEPRFREQIYNWYKNTIGRTRRKLEGRPRSSKKVTEKAAQNNITWSTNLATPTIIPYSQGSTPANTLKPSLSTPTPQYGGYQPNMPVASTSGPSGNLSVNISLTSIRDAFLSPAVDAPSLSSMIQTYAMSKASRIPLTTVIDALFQAISIAQSSQATSKPYPAGDSSYQLLRRFIEVSSYFPQSVTHAHSSGALAGPRALQMTIRKTSVWMPIGFNPDTPSPQLSMVDEMERIAFDRQRRKDYIQWARIHAAAIELGMLGVNGDSNNQLVSGRSFSEVMAKDSVWQEDEVEWCAGIFIVRAIIRTGLRGGPAQRQEYEEILSTYEGRWKEIKDEARQALVTVRHISISSLPFDLTNLKEALLAAKEDLANLDKLI